MTFTYNFQTSPDVYSEYTDECFCDWESFDYEPNNFELHEAIDCIIAKEYFNNEIKIVHNFLNEFDLYDYLEESLEDVLRDYFEEKAFQDYYRRKEV